MAYILNDAGYVIGTYDGPGQPANGTNILPPADAAIPLRFVNGAWQKAAPKDMRVTRLAFINRFTMEEWINTDTASATVPTIKYFLTKINAARYIDLSRPEVRNGVALIASNGLLTQQRAVEVLDTPIQEMERLDGSEI